MFCKFRAYKTKNDASERISAYCEGTSTYISYMRELPTTRINTIFVCASKRELQLFLLDPGAPNFVVRNSPKTLASLALGYSSKKNIGEAVVQELVEFPKLVCRLISKFFWSKIGIAQLIYLTL